MTALWPAPPPGAAPAPRTGGTPPLPAHRADGTLPPFAGERRGPGANVAPFPASLSEVSERFVTTPARAHLFRGLLSLRASLRAAGIVKGVHWLGGSFVEARREPRDLDLVTLFARPAAWADPEVERREVAARPEAFVPREAKRAFLCDAYLVDAGAPPPLLVKWTYYWYSLYAHDAAGAWKGFVQTPLDAPDADAAVRRALDARFPPPPGSAPAGDPRPGPAEVPPSPPSEEP